LSRLAPSVLLPERSAVTGNLANVDVDVVGNLEQVDSANRDGK